MASWSSGEPRNLRYAQPLVPPHTKSILCYGDSLTAGYCEGGFAFSPYAPALERALGGSVRVDQKRYVSCDTVPSLCRGAPPRGLSCSPTQAMPMAGMAPSESGPDARFLAFQDSLC